MVRSILAVLLLVTVVSATGAGGGYKKKLLMKYFMSNLFEKCVGQQALDKFVLEHMKAAKRCYTREFDADVSPVYIKPYPVEGNNVGYQRNNVGYHTHPQQTYNNQPFQQYQQPPFPQQQQYQQYQQPQYNQQPQYQQQQYRQQQYGNFQQPQNFYGPGFGFQPYPNQVNNNNNRVHNRQTRQANKNKNVQNVKNNVEAETTVAGEAELYYYNKMKHHLTSKVGNFSCIMNELGYFTDNEVNVEKYKQAYQELTLPEAMKEEFIDNIDVCHEVSTCLPDSCFQKYPYGLEYGRQFFFVMCEKKKAMEVCLKKQMIDDYYKYKDLLEDEDIPDDLEDSDDLFAMTF